MRIIWDDDKNDWLKKHRSISFEMISEKISNGDILDVLTNPSPNYSHQGVFVLWVQLLNQCISVVKSLSFHRFFSTLVIAAML
jgi:hypothetical protein